MEGINQLFKMLQYEYSSHSSSNLQFRNLWQMRAFNNRAFIHDRTYLLFINCCRLSQLSTPSESLAFLKWASNRYRLSRMAESRSWTSTIDSVISPSRYSSAIAASSLWYVLIIFLISRIASIALSPPFLDDPAKERQSMTDRVDCISILTCGRFSLRSDLILPVLPKCVKVKPELLKSILSLLFMRLAMLPLII